MKVPLKPFAWGATVGGLLSDHSIGDLFAPIVRFRDGQVQLTGELHTKAQRDVGEGAGRVRGMAHHVLEPAR